MQCRRIQTAEPEDDDFLFRRLVDFQFLIVALLRLRRAVVIASRVPLVSPTITHALAEFDSSLPDVKRMRDVAEHIDEYATDSLHRHDQQVYRYMLEVPSWDNGTLRWLDGVLPARAAIEASQRLFAALVAADRQRQEEHANDLR